MPPACSEPPTLSDPADSRVEPWDAIVLCGMPFDGDPPFSDTHLSRALADRHRVLVVNPPEPLHQRSTSRRRRLVQVHERLWQLTPWSLPGPDRPGLALVNDPLIARQIERAAQTVLSHERVLVSFASQRGHLRGVDRRYTVYWRRDLPAQHPYVPSVRHAKARNLDLIAHADLVTAVSPPLVDDARQLNRRVRLIPNGADLGHFSSATKPPPGLPEGVLLGYLGAVSWRVDMELVEMVADARPDWTIVLVGEVSVPVPLRPNVRAVGPRPYAELPSWTQRFDVGLVPYSTAHFNRSSFPLKVFDYLAAGVPVVSTDLPGLADLEPLVRRTDSAGGFLAALDAVLATPPSAQSCYELARHHSWSVRAAELEGLIDASLRNCHHA